jgi:hypothetical protein
MRMACGLGSPRYGGLGSLRYAGPDGFFRSSVHFRLKCGAGGSWDGAPDGKELAIGDGGGESRIVEKLANRRETRAKQSNCETFRPAGVSPVLAIHKILGFGKVVAEIRY